jgi:hypothetical protein
MEEVVKATAGEMSATVESTRTTSYGFRWLIVRTPRARSRISSSASTRLELDRGRRLRRAAALRGVRVQGRRRRAINFIYNYKRGSWYPFVPGPQPARELQQRSTERELQLKAQIGGELPIEPELERWFPLWGIPF